MRKILITAVILAGIILSANGAFALFADVENEKNRIDIGSVTTEITEEFEEPQDPAPGDVITKKVRIRSVGESDCLVRVQVLFSDSEAEKICSLNYNTADWEYSDGWWYYRSILHTGDSTEPLFTEASLSSDAEEIRAFDILVRQESRQAEGSSVWEKE